MEKQPNTQQKRHVRSGDKVMIIAGNNKGKTGVITRIITDKQRAIVEGDDIIQLTKHIKPTTNSPQGSLVKVFPTIHLSNIQVVDTKTGEPTRTGRKLNDKGKLQRFSKKTGNFI